MTKIYLAHSISTTGEFNDSIRVANEIRALGYDCYAAAENSAINDKSNEPTVEDIYDGDISEIMSCGIFVVNIDGNLQTGTISEVGFVAGWNERTVDLIGDDFSAKLIIGYTSNARLLQPQFHKGIPSAHANHLVLGMIERFGEFAGGEADMLRKLSELRGG